MLSGKQQKLIRPVEENNYQNHNEVLADIPLPKLDTQNTQGSNRFTQEVGDQVETTEIPQGMKRKKKQFAKVEKKSKKRKRNPNEWKRRKAALAREKGQAYSSQSGKEVPQKEINLGTLCNLNCRFKCSKIDHEQRKKIFDNFYSLTTDAKNTLIFKSIFLEKVCRPKMNAKVPRTVSYKFFITCDSNNIRVCKAAFCSLLQVGRKKVDLMAQKVKSGLTAPPPDQRGHHNNRPHKITDDVKQIVKEHIESFPSELSHYSRHANINKKYLSPLLNLRIMHSLYLDKCVEKNLPPCFHVKKCTYINIFENEYNLSFNKPRSDTCSTCDSGTGSAEHTENVEAAFKSQQNDRQKGRDKNGNRVCYLTVDLQQSMPLPKLSTNKAFYLRQLWFYNLGFHIISNNEERGVFFTWTENVANRGSHEICSSLMTLIDHEDEIMKKTDHLIIWSDSCAGQNKNWLLLCLYQYLILNKVFKIIDHKYPEVGHTYLDSDRDFGRIEKVIRKHETIYTPDKYREIISAASRKNLVVDMHNHFRDFEDFDKKLGLINRKKNLGNEKVPFRNLKWIRVDEFGSFLYKESYCETTPFKKVSLLRANRTSNTNKKLDIKIHRLKQQKGSLSEEKVKNLKEQLKFVREEHRWFYEDIIKEHENKMNG